MKATVKHELRVAFSKKAQPVWFRIAKWVILIGAVIALWGKPALWWFVGGLTIAGLIVHFTWRWKTKGWTQPWLGWNDVKAGKDS
jgi:hypothetical protein